MRFRSLLSRHINDSMNHSDSFGFQNTTARYIFFMVRFSIFFWSTRMAVSFFAMRIRPLVSLSRRWTNPGRSIPLITESFPKWWRSPLTSVPDFPYSHDTGWTFIPASLLITAKSWFSNTTSSSIASHSNFILSTLHSTQITFHR